MTTWKEAQDLAWEVLKRYPKAAMDELTWDFWFAILVDMEEDRLTYERIVLKHQHRFAPEVVEAAKRKIAKAKQA